MRIFFYSFVILSLFVKSSYSSIEFCPSIELLVLKSDLIACCTCEVENEKMSFHVKTVLLGESSNSIDKIKTNYNHSEWKGLEESEILLFFEKKKQ